MNLLWIQSLWIISLGTPSASLRLGFSKVERVLSLAGKFPGWGRPLTHLKALLVQQGILKVSSEPAQTPYLHIFLWHPASLLELPKWGAAPLLSILRVKWLIQEQVSSCGKVKVRIKILSTGCWSVPFLLLVKQPLKCRQCKAWFQSWARIRTPGDLIEQILLGPTLWVLSQEVCGGLENLYF